MISRDLLSVVLGGGAGTRLFPLTQRRSKPAVPLAGKYRLIDIPVSNSINSGINRIFVLTQYNSASLNRHIAVSYRFDTFSKGFVTILAAEQTPQSTEWFQGTADAVRRSLPHINAHAHTHVLILSGDQLYLMNYEEMFDYHQQCGAEITVATIPVTAEEATSFGILKTDKDGRIVEFREKPPAEELPELESAVPEEAKAQGRIYLASMGIYIFGRDTLRQELDDTREFVDFGKEIIPHCIKNKPVYSYPFTGYWSDIGTIRSFYEANLDLARRQPDFDLYDPNMMLFTNARMLPPSKLQGSFVVDSMIAEGSIIVNSQISNSVVGIRSYIGDNTTIKNSVLMGADYFRWHAKDRRLRVEGPDEPGIGTECYIEGAIIDKNVSVGHHCIIKNRDDIQEADGDNYYIRDGVVILPKNAVIPDGTII